MITIPYPRQLATSAAILILLTGCMMLHGCQSSGPATQEQIQAMGNVCQQYGFKPGSTEFAQCIANLDAQRVQEAQIAAQRRVAAGVAMMNAGNGMQQANRMTTCRTIRLGNSLQTQCM